MERMHEEAYQRLTVYYWCWMFMRLSPALLYARTRNLKPSDAALAKVMDTAGELAHANFDMWWQSCGVVAFAEQRLREVQLMRHGERAHDHSEDGPSRTLYVKIPLTIRPRTITRQVKALLDRAGHDGKRFDAAPYSTAPFPLYTLRYHVRNIEHRHWVLLYRLLYPEVPIWMIGDRLRLAPALQVRGLWPSTDEVVKRRAASLHSLTGRHLYKARYMLMHLEQGDFPRDTKIDDTTDWHRPFGAKHAKRYQQFVQGSDLGTDSEWIAKIKQSHMTPLREHVAQINRVTLTQPLPPEVIEGVDAFMRGERDHITPQRRTRS
jgi:hypothetical protein